MNVSLHVQVSNYGLGKELSGFTYCLGFMGTLIDLLLKPMFIVCIVIMMVQSVVEFHWARP